MGSFCMFLWSTHPKLNLSAVIFINSMFLLTMFCVGPNNEKFSCLNVRIKAYLKNLYLASVLNLSILSWNTFRPLVLCGDVGKDKSKSTMITSHKPHYITSYHHTKGLTYQSQVWTQRHNFNQILKRKQNILEHLKGAQNYC